MHQNAQVIYKVSGNIEEEEKVLCIIRNLLDSQSQGQKFTLNLPASYSVGQMVKDVAKTCGYVADTISVIYEKPIEGGNTEEMNLELYGDLPMGELCTNPLVKRNNFTVNEKDEVIPQKLLTESASDAAAGCVPSCSTSTATDTQEGCSSYPDYSYSYALTKSDTGFVGLINQAMTCYLNSLLQTLYMTPEFRNALYRWEFDGDESESIKNIPSQLQNLFLQLQTSKKRATETTDLTKSFGWDSSEVWQQHDVQELLRVMFDALETKWKNTNQSDIINDLYQGKMKDYVKCLECGNESARMDTYLDIPLVIRPFGSNQPYGSVSEALKAFVQPETLEGTNQYSCEKCDKKCDAHKGLKFQTFPYLLTLQLKRFDFDYATLHRVKLNDRMTFPEVLSLNHLISSEAIDTPSNWDGMEPAVTELADSSDEGIDEGIDIENGASAALTGSDSSSIGSGNSSEAIANDKNAQKSEEITGPYVYELFSIMIHSGSAAGGHYYAYIKSFKDGQWYSFNDQHVSKITYDDIRKTYGGSSSGRSSYSAAYASSTNAYMLMYRQVDKEQNADFLQPEDFPEPLKIQLQNLKDKEEAEKKQREIDRSTCKIKLFCYHPIDQKRQETKLEIHKDKTLSDATEIAWKTFELETLVTVDRCRLVKYDEYNDSLERSYEGEGDTPMGKLLGGVKATYTFDLLLETRRADQVFQEYRPGGVTAKVYVADLEADIIHPPVSIRAYHSQTVSEFKTLVAQFIGTSATNMRCVLERYHNDLRLLTVPNKTLKSEGFFRSNKVFIECSGNEKELSLPFAESHFSKLLDRFQNTIRIIVNLPSIEDVKVMVSNTEQQSVVQSDGNSTGDKEARGDHNNSDLSETCQRLQITSPLHGAHSDPCVYHGPDDVETTGHPARTNSPDLQNKEASHSSSTNSPIEGGNGSGKLDSVNAGGDLGLELGSDDKSLESGAATAGGDMVTNGAEKTVKSNKISVMGQDVSTDNLPKPTENWYANPSDKSIEEWEEEEYGRYFQATENSLAETGQRSITVYVDKRITLGSLKKQLETYVGIASENFKVYRVYSNNQEFESTRLAENLAFLDDGKLNIKLGRALRTGEYRVKVYQLLVNEPEPSKFLIDTIFAKGMTVIESKKLILPDIKSHCSFDIPLNRCRLRKKTWKNPGNIYVDNQAYVDDIQIFANWEVFLEVLDGPEQLTSISQLAIFVRRWRPSKFELDPFQEIVVQHQTVDQLKRKLAEIAGIELENVEFAKGRSTFPCDVSLLEIHTDLDWNPQVSALNMWPLYICDDGNVIFYRDKGEELMELAEDRKKEIQQKENARLTKIGARLTYSPRKEKPLRIYTDESPASSR